MKIPYAIIFVTVFLIAFVARYYLSAGGFVDPGIWADQIQYQLTNDPRAVGLHSAPYAYPGTTITGLGIVLHTVFGASYATALMLSISLLIAAATASAVTLCYLLRPASPWWITAALIFIVHRMFYTAVPATAVVSPMVALLVFYAWWMLEQKGRISWMAMFGWGAIVGLAAATRIDITLLCALPFLALLVRRFGWRSAPIMVGGAAATFFIADPFLWTIPGRHMADIVRKFTTTYAELTPDRIPWSEAFEYASLGLVSFGWGLVWLLKGRLKQVIPVQVFVALWLVTVFTASVVLTASYQQMRYFYPLILIWEVLLPLFILSTVDSEATGRVTRRTTISVTAFAIIWCAWVFLNEFRFISTYS